MPFCHSSPNLLGCCYLCSAFVATDENITPGKKPKPAIAVGAVTAVVILIVLKLSFHRTSIDTTASRLQRRLHRPCVLYR